MCYLTPVPKIACVDFFAGADLNQLLGLDGNKIIEGSCFSEIATLWSQQGSRQGCAAGTESFCYVIDGPVREMHRRFPNFIFKVLTDDIVVMCPPPERNTAQHWKEVLEEYESMLQQLGS